jgi:hypothetical protein
MEGAVEEKSALSTENGTISRFGLDKMRLM